MLESITYTFKLLKGNMHSIFLLVLSLSFILATISSICIILDSNYETMFEVTQKTLDEKFDSHLSVRIPIKRNYSSFPIDEMSQILDNLNASLNQVGLDSYLNSTWINPEMQCYFVNLSNTLNKRSNTFYFAETKDKAITELLLPGGRLSENANEIVIALPVTLSSSIQINSSYDFGLSSHDDGTSSSSLTVVGIIPLIEMEKFASYEAYYSYKTMIKTKTGLDLNEKVINIICRQNDYPAIIRNIVEYSKFPEDFNEQGAIQVYYRFNSYSFNTQEISSLLNQLNQLDEMIKQNYPYTGYYWQTEVGFSNLEQELGNFKSIWLREFINFLFIILPVLIISFYLTMFVVNTTNFSRMKMNQTLNIRGLSIRQEFKLLLLEAIVVLVLSILIGLGMGALVTSYWFQITKIGLKLTINPTNWISYLFLGAGICIMFIYRKVSIQIYRLHSNRSIYGFIQSEQVSSHLWASKALIGGIFLYLFSIVLLKIVDRTLLISVLGIMAYNAITFGIAMLAAIFMFIGLLFTLKTSFSQIMAYLSKKTWPKNNNIITLAFKNLTRFARTSADIWLFLSLLIAYSLSVTTYTVSMNSFHWHQAEFSTAADYKLAFQPEDESALLEFISQNITQVSSFTQVTITNAIYKMEADNNYIPISLLGIDPSSYFEVTKECQQSKFSPSLSQFENDILNKNTSVCVSEYFLETENLYLGDTYPLRIVKENLSTHTYFYESISNFTISASYAIIPKLTDWQHEELSLLVHQDFLENLNDIQTVLFGRMAHILLLKCISDIPLESIQFLEKTFGLTVTSIEEEYQELRTEGSWAQLDTVQQVTIAITLFLAAGCLLVFGFFQIGVRTRERAVERAMGLKNHQILGVFLVEELIIILSALITGGFTGILISSTLFHAIWQNSWRLQPVIIFPLTAFLQYMIWLSGFMLVSLLPSSFLLKKTETSFLLKQYE